MANAPIREFTVVDALAMKFGDIAHANGHEIERVATGWFVDERFTFSANIVEYLVKQSDLSPALPHRDAGFDFINLA